MNEIVKYHNELNRLNFKGLSEYDLNFLMAICSRVRELNEQVVTFDFDYLMELTEWDRSKKLDVFIKDLKRSNSKLLTANSEFTDEHGVSRQFTLFETFTTDPNKRTLTVRINPDFSYLLNELSKNFTRFELVEYVRLEGKYAKLLYQHLKQFRKSGWWQVSVSDIKTLLSIPDSYETKHIMDKVLKPSIEVIRSCKGFSDLSVEVIRSSRRGRAVDGYKLRWTASDQIKGQMDMDDAMQEQKKYRAEKKKHKNKFNDYPQNEYDYDELERILVKNK